jgi:hypothetical protein
MYAARLRRDNTRTDESFCRHRSRSAAESVSELRGHSSKVVDKPVAIEMDETKRGYLHVMAGTPESETLKLFTPPGTRCLPIARTLRASRCALAYNSILAGS